MSDQFEGMTDDVLLAELERRKLEVEDVEQFKLNKIKSQHPVHLRVMDFNPVVKMCETIIEEMAKSDYCDDNDNAHYLYEVSMTAVFGNDVWKWINKVVV